MGLKNPTRTPISSNARKSPKLTEVKPAFCAVGDIKKDFAIGVFRLSIGQL